PLFLPDPASTALYTLSLHDALPIWVQALDVIAANRDRFEVVGLSAGSNRERLAEQAAEFGVSETALGASESEQLVTSVAADVVRSEEHTSELQSRENLVCRLLLDKK